MSGAAEIDDPDASNRRDNDRLFFAAEVLVAREDRGWRTAVLVRGD